TVLFALAQSFAGCRPSAAKGGLFAGALRTAARSLLLVQKGGDLIKNILLLGLCTLLPWRLHRLFDRLRLFGDLRRFWRLRTRLRNRRGGWELRFIVHAVFRNRRFGRRFRRSFLR